MVANPLYQDITRVAASQAQAAVAWAAMAKEEKYTAWASSGNFLPIAIEISGRVHHQFDRLLQQVARDTHAQTGSILTTHFHQQILVML